MLVLSRKKNETIIIDGQISITVMEVRKDGSVRLGIDAPPEIEIHREEVYRMIREENLLAARESGEKISFKDIWQQGQQEKDKPSDK